MSDPVLSGGAIAFSQPDRTVTVLDLKAGHIVRRGGSIPGWPETARCQPQLDSSVCTLPAGQLVRSQTPPATELEWSGETQWKASSRHTNGRVWQANGHLLLETTNFDVVVLECLDRATGESRWMYVMDEGPYGGSLATESARVTEARQHLKVDATTLGYLATLQPEKDGVSLDNPPPYRGTLVVDPDPFGAAEVSWRVRLGVGILVGFIIAVVAVAAIGQTSGAMAAVRIALSAGLTALVLWAWWLDDVLAWAALLVYAAHWIICWVLDVARPLLVVLAVVTVGALLVPAIAVSIIR